MNLATLVWRELLERKAQMLTVARELDSLGSNVLVLPKSVSLQDSYAADMHDEVIPEEYVMRLTMSDLQGVDNLSPKLCLPITIDDIR